MRTVAAPVKATRAQPFPAAAVEAALRREVLISIRAAAETLEVSVPANDTAASAMPFELDSLIVVEILCVLDAILPFEVSESVVQAGGYDSVDEALKDLLPKLAELWNKHWGTKP